MTPRLGETPEEKTAQRMVQAILGPRGWTDQEMSLAYGLVLREYFNEEYQDNLRFARSWIAEEMDADEVYLVTVGVDMASEGTESWSAFLDNRETEQTIRYDFNTEAERDAFCDGYEIEPDEEIAVFFDEGRWCTPLWKTISFRKYAIILCVNPDHYYLK